MVRADLSFLSSRFLLVHELLVMKLVGRDMLMNLAEEWTRTNVGRGLQLGIARRKELY